MITAAAGYFLAAHGIIKLDDLAALLVGLALVVAAGCVCNNYLDRGIDMSMERTKKRALVTGDISPRRALLFGGALGSAGLIILSLWTNYITLVLAAFGFVAYVIIYGLAKRRTVYSTLIGSISGAVPPIVGYSAASGRLDFGGLLLFILIAAWQVPHFYAIAIYRRSEYQAAGLPIFSVVRGVAATKRQILASITITIMASLLLTMAGYTGWSYAVIALIAGLSWLFVAVKNYHSDDDIRWARQVFGLSLLYVVTISVALSLSHWLP